MDVIHPELDDRYITDSINSSFEEKTSDISKIDEEESHSISSKSEHENSEDLEKSVDSGRSFDDHFSNDMENENQNN